MPKTKTKTKTKITTKAITYTAAGVAIFVALTVFSGLAYAGIFQYQKQTDYNNNLKQAQEFIKNNDLNINL